MVRADRGIEPNGALRSGNRSFTPTGSSIRQTECGSSRRMIRAQFDGLFEGFDCCVRLIQRQAGASEKESRLGMRRINQCGGQFHACGSCFALIEKDAPQQVVVGGNRCLVCNQGFEIGARIAETINQAERACATASDRRLINGFRRRIDAGRTTGSFAARAGKRLIKRLDSGGMVCRLLHDETEFIPPECAMRINGDRPMQRSLGNSQRRAAAGGRSA
jgi:hypothetical protein